MTRKKKSTAAETGSSSTDVLSSSGSRGTRQDTNFRSNSATGTEYSSVPFPGSSQDVQLGSSMTTAVGETGTESFVQFLDNGHPVNGLCHEIKELITKIKNVFDFPSCTSVTKTDKENIKSFADQINQRIDSVLGAVSRTGFRCGVSVSQPVTAEVLEDLLRNQKTITNSIEALRNGPKRWSDVVSGNAASTESVSPDLRVQKQVKKRKKVYSLVVKDKEEKTDHKTKIKKLVRTTGNTEGMNFRSLSKGVVRMEFDRKADRDSVLEEVTETLPSFKAEKSVKQNPLVILKGVAKDTVDNDSILDSLYQKNGCFDSMVGRNGDFENHLIRVVRIQKNKNEHLRNVIIEVSPRAYHAMLSTETGRINIGYQRVHVAHQSRFIQCYKCHGFGHTTKHCQASEDVCGRCTENHRTAFCGRSVTESPRCVNCIRFNVRFKKATPVNHRPSSEHCPHVRRMMERVEEETEYSVEGEDDKDIGTEEANRTD